MTNPLIRQKAQSGLSLPIVLILLIPLTFLAITVAQRNNLEELMAANQRDGQQSLMNAESGLAMAQEILDRVDADTFASTLTQILISGGDIGINGYQLYDGTVTALVVDNYEPEEDINPGFQDPYIDQDGRVLVTSTGLYRGGERIVQAIYYLQKTGARHSAQPPLVIFAEDDLTISGNPFIWGPNANVHTNSNMDISGNPIISGAVTAAGDMVISGNPVNEDGDPIAWAAGVDAIATPYVFPPAYKPFANLYFTADCDVHSGWPATVENLVYDDVKNNGPWNGWNCDYNKEWILNGSEWIEGFIYCECNVIISSNPGEGLATPAKMSIVAEGFIEVSGNPFIEPFYSDEFDINDPTIQQLIGGRQNVLLTNEVLFYAGNDLKINGNPLQNFTGVLAAHMEFAISGNPSIQGSVIAENGRAQEAWIRSQGQACNSCRSQEVNANRDVKNIIDLNYISGNPNITGDNNSNDPAPPAEIVPVGAILEAWREVVE